VTAAGVPGVIALVDDGPGEPWLGASGLADTATGRPMTPDLRFPVASVTKSFVAVVALQPADEGRLSLADTAERWLPGILPYGDRVTLRHLLSHTAGVPDHLAVPLAVLYAGDRFRAWTPPRARRPGRRCAAAVPRRHRLVVLQHRVRAGRHDHPAGDARVPGA